MGDLDLIKMCWRHALCGQARCHGAARRCRSAVCTMPFHENHIGNAQLPALHGGSLASFLEITAILQLAREQAAVQQVDSIEAGRAAIPLPVNVTVQYLRAHVLWRAMLRRVC